MKNSIPLTMVAVAAVIASLVYSWSTIDARLQAREAQRNVTRMQAAYAEYWKNYQRNYPLPILPVRP